MADLDAASLDDVKNWFRAKYGPDNAVLVLAGDIDLKTAKAKATKWFGDIARGPAVARVNAPVPTLAAPVTVVMKDNVATTRIQRLWAIPGLNDKDAVALDVAGAVLGGLSSSRFDNQLVRKEQIAVSVSASASLFEIAGMFTVSADVKPGVDPTLVARRLDEIVADFLAKGPTEDEVRRAATREIAGKINGLESVGGFSGKAVSLAEGLVYSGDADFARKTLVKFGSIKPAAVTAAVRKWLSRPAFNLTVEPGERAADKDDVAAAPKAAVPSVRADMSPPVMASKGGVDRSKPPAVEALTALDFPAIERAKLSNGIEVFFAKRSGVPTVKVSVNFDAGYSADPASGIGTQSLMLTMMNEGTKTRTSAQIAEESERLGASVSTGASLDRTSISLSALTPNLAPSLDLLADVVRNPAFAPAEVERLRAAQLNRIAAELSAPEGLAARIMPTKLWGVGHPYAIPSSGTGDPTIVRKLTPQDLAAFHQRWLRPDTARILIVGDTSLAKIVPLLEKSFGSWSAAQGPRPSKNFDIALPATPSKIYFVDRPNSPQSIILAGQVLDAKGSDDLINLRAANDVFGGSFISRINTDLRETKGWSYGVSSGIRGLENRIAFAMSAPVQADKTGDSIIALRSQLSAFLGPKGVTADELQRTVNGSIRELPGSFETSSDVLGGLTQIVNLGRPDDYYETLAQKYRSVTAADLDASARNKIDPKSLIFVVVGDAKTVRGQLDAVGLPVETVVAPSAK